MTEDDVIRTIDEAHRIPMSAEDVAEHLMLYGSATLFQRNGVTYRVL